eukprot:762760-Hanusia_phi.AAC.15
MGGADLKFWTGGAEIDLPSGWTPAMIELWTYPRVLIVPDISDVFVVVGQEQARVALLARVKVLPGKGAVLRG